MTDKMEVDEPMSQEPVGKPNVDATPNESTSRGVPTNTLPEASACCVPKTGRKVVKAKGAKAVAGKRKSQRLASANRRRSKSKAQVDGTSGDSPNSSAEAEEPSSKPTIQKRPRSKTISKQANKRVKPSESQKRRKKPSGERRRKKKPSGERRRRKPVASEKRRSKSSGERRKKPSVTQKRRKKPSGERRRKKKPSGERRRRKPVASEKRSTKKPSVDRRRKPSVSQKRSTKKTSAVSRRKPATSAKRTTKKSSVNRRRKPSVSQKRSKKKVSGQQRRTKPGVQPSAVRRSSRLAGRGVGRPRTKPKMTKREERALHKANLQKNALEFAKKRREKAKQEKQALK